MNDLIAQLQSTSELIVNLKVTWDGIVNEALESVRDLDQLRRIQDDLGKADPTPELAFLKHRSLNDIRRLIRKEHVKLQGTVCQLEQLLESMNKEIERSLSACKNVSYSTPEEKLSMTIKFSELFRRFDYVRRFYTNEYLVKKYSLEEDIDNDADKDCDGQLKNTWKSGAKSNCHIHQIIAYLEIFANKMHEL